MSASHDLVTVMLTDYCMEMSKARFRKCTGVMMKTLNF